MAAAEAAEAAEAAKAAEASGANKKLSQANSTTDANKTNIMLKDETKI